MYLLKLVLVSCFTTVHSQCFKVLEVITKEPIQVDVASIVIDETNPNVMKQDQIDSLKVSLQKYGNVHPIVLDEATKTVADGYHRVIAYQQLGLPTIPAILVRFDNDNERKLCRQVMNKLHGTHDPDKDIAELQLLMDYDRKQMEELLSIDTSYMQDLERINREQQQNFLSTVTGPKVTTEDAVQQGQDVDPEMYKRDTFLHGNIKQITLFFNNDEFTQIYPRVQNAMLDMNISNQTELFIELLTFYETWRDKVKPQPEPVST